MQIANLNATMLRGIIRHMERRDALAAEIKKLDTQIEALLAGGTPKARASAQPVRRRRRRGARRKTATAPKPAAKSPASPPATARRVGRRGALKAKILRILRGAGSEGAAVRDIAATLKIKPQNIHVWFSSTGKNVPGLTRISEGRYRLAP